MNCLLVCPLGLEFDAVKSHLSDVKEVKDFPCYCITGTLVGINHRYQITLLQTGAKNTDTALLTEKAIHRFAPNIAFLIGVAGGVKDVSILDVVIANEVFNYESGKVTDEGFVARPDAYRLHRDFLTLSESVIRANQWRSRSATTATASTVFIGAICAGEKVVSNTSSEVYQSIKKHYNHCLALEMEAIGFTKALSYYPLIQTAIIRGISDLIDGKSHSDEGGNQPKAVANAAAFAFELLYQFDYSQITIPPMDIKTIAATTFTSLLPLLKKSKSIQQVSEEVSKATDTTLGTLWQKVKPIFIEEFEEDAELSEDAVKEDAVLYVLKKILKKNETLKQELEALLDKAKEDGTSANVVITDSKNVMTGGNINTGGGNFQLGDNHSTTTHIGQQVNNPFQNNQGIIHVGDVINIQHVLSSSPDTLSKVEENETIQHIQELVGNNKIKQALETLLKFSKTRDREFGNQVTLLTSRWNRLKRERFQGTISVSNANIEQNRILAALLHIAEEL